jgi:hypothetical protein
VSDEYQSIPVADARAAVQASGELEGIEGPHYLSAQSPDWRPYFAPSEDGIAHPDFARVVVTRKGQRPRDVVISWDEYAEQMDADPEWDALRASKPMSIFGAEVERHAYRVTFADVLAPLMTRRASDPNDNAPWATPEPVTAPTQDWIAEVKQAASGEALNSLYDEAKAAGALVKVDGLQGAFMERMLDLEHPKPKPAPRPTDKPGPRPQGNRRRKGKPKP